MSYNRAYNFSAGPSMLPLSVIESVAENREFDTSFSIAKTRHIEITPLAVNFFVKFYDFVSACWCLL